MYGRRTDNRDHSSPVYREVIEIGSAETRGVLDGWILIHLSTDWKQFAPVYSPLMIWLTTKSTLRTRTAICCPSTMAHQAANEFGRAINCAQTLSGTHDNR
jgi:hypothetical protein